MRVQLVFSAAALALAAATPLAVGSKADAPDARPPAKNVGKAAVAHAGPHVGAARLRAMLRRPPLRPLPGVPESCVKVGPCGEEESEEQDWRRASTPVESTPRRPQSSRAASPKLANDPGFAAAVGGTPPDPQIAVSSTHVLVGLVDRVAFYTKSGTPYPSSSNTVIATTLFQPLIQAANLSPDAKGHIDSFSDLRAIFDPYRKRFWLAATGAYRGCVVVDGKCAKGYTTLPAKQRRTVIGVAVSVDEDPTHGWYLYWWDAAVGWGTTNAPYHVGDMGDYPSLGVNAVTVDVSVKVGDAKRAYPHIALYDANAMAAGSGPTIDGWSLYPLFKDDSTCNGGFRNPDGTCPGSIIQPTLAHPDPGGRTSSAATDQRGS